MLGATFSQAHYDLYKETGNKNLFEEVLDQLVMDEHLDLPKEVKFYIMSEESRENKRLYILANLLKDHSAEIVESFNKVREFSTRTENLKNALLTLNKYIEVGQQEVKKYGEVFTPLSLVKEMVATLPEEVWANPNLKWIDPCNGMGNFPLIVIYKLMKGLEIWEPDAEKRYKHIIENMIYVCELQPRNAFMYLSLVDPKDDLNVNLYCGSFLDEGFDKHMKEVWNIDKFDIVIGNPPYQEEIEGNNRHRPIYNVFSYKSFGISNMVLFVTPSRWMVGGFGLDKFRKDMFESKNLKMINHIDDAATIFGNSVDIMGGVSYYLFDKEYEGYPIYNGIETNLNEFDIFVGVKQRPLLRKILNNNNFLSNICKSKSYWMNFNDGLLDSESLDDNTLCYVSQNKGLRKYIKVDLLNKDYQKYKVFTPSANGNSPKFGNKILGYPGEVASNTYMTFLVNSEDEGKSLISYMNTKFCNFFLSLRKKTQNMKPDTCKWIPMVPFNREWTDEMLYEYFKLTQEEIDLIEKK